ncbi:DUF3617 domain-containing protein [Sphingomonas canadensis]|uniref:DUF3617 domain-containing protein n=1 Tax=Sphingomonas canadensis TaxID=1219257 RepID=A0ABW3H935_9SPHN|nr:DUF3617 domain-containing protein [Sphingomonas canadensis]MCW3836581.1 DUF3617 domain-containing protein [Sphingomonas canadensis]
MKYLIVPALAGAVLIAGCNKGAGTDGNATANATAAAPAAPVKIEPNPGNWEWTEKTELVEVTNVPDDVAAALQDQMNTEKTETECITPEQAKLDIIKFVKLDEDGACMAGNVTTAPGSFSAKVRCGKPGEEMQGEGEAKGIISPEAVSYTMEMNTNVPNTEGGMMKVKATRTGKRIGACEATGG